MSWQIELVQKLKINLGEDSGHNSDQSSCVNIEAVLVTVAVCFIAVLVFRKFSDSDVWWQTAIGRDILHSFSVPTTDRYSVGGWSRPYHDSHWLFQLLLAVVDSAGGLVAVGIVPVIIWCGTFWITYSGIRQCVGPCITALLLTVLAIACNFRFVPRPDIVTCCMVAIYYTLLQKGKCVTYSQIAGFAVLQLIWSNSHGLFVIGPFMVLCYLGEACLKRFRDPQILIIYFIRLWLVVMCASILTPYGVDGWSYAGKLVVEAGPQAEMHFRNIAELAPVFGPLTMSNPDGWGFLLIAGTLLFTLMFMKRNSQISLARTVIILVFLGAALTGRRNIPIFSIPAVILLAELLVKSEKKLRCPSPIKYAIVVLLVCSIWFVMSGSFYRYFDYGKLAFGIGPSAEAMPYQLPKFLKDEGFTGVIYNSNRLGGFCLYNGFLPMIDGRWEVYDPNMLSILLEAPLNTYQWDALIAQYGILGVLLENGMPETKALVSRFVQDGSFRQVYGDSVASFWIINRK